ncbi:MAG TPA: hypothetical protein VLZ54_07725 [Arenibacter sp.]|nr:hypothetical protein [Arenibacter sp.]
MRNLFKLGGIFLLGIALSFNVACSSDDDGPGDQLGKLGTMTMKIDGKQWEADVATVMTMSDEELEDTEDMAYLVVMNGTKVISVDSGEVSESISLTLILTQAAFNNPKRSFPVNGMGEQNIGQGVIMYKNMAENGTDGGGVYLSVHSDDPDQSVGTITVKDYKIGNQSFLGQILGKGYTELSGTFEAKLYSYDGSENPLKEMVITDGKFNLNSDLLSGLGI